MTYLEIIAVFTSFMGIYLTAKRWVLCWPVNLVACALYFKLFQDERLYSDMMLQLCFGVTILFGWFLWARGKEEVGEVTVQKLHLLPACVALLIGAIGAASIGWFTSTHTNAALPWMDATLSSFSLVAQYWTARRHAASWILWIVVDIFYVSMFAYKELWLTAGLYAAMIGLAAMGYRQWRKARVTATGSAISPAPSHG